MFCRRPRRLEPQQRQRHEGDPALGRGPRRASCVRATDAAQDLDPDPEPLEQRLVPRSDHDVAAFRRDPPQQLPRFLQIHPLLPGVVVEARALDPEIERPRSRSDSVAGRARRRPASGRSETFAFRSQHGEEDGAARSRPPKRNPRPPDERGDEDRHDEEARSPPPDRERPDGPSAPGESEHAPPEPQARETGQRRGEPGDPAPRERRVDASARSSPARTAAAGKSGMTYTSRFMTRTERKTSPKTSQPPASTDLRRAQSAAGAKRIQGNAPQASRGAVEERAAEVPGEVVGRRAAHELVRPVETSARSRGRAAGSSPRARGGRRPGRRAPPKSRRGAARTGRARSNEKSRPRSRRPGARSRSGPCSRTRTPESGPGERPDPERRRRPRRRGPVRSVITASVTASVRNASAANWRAKRHELERRRSGSSAARTAARRPDRRRTQSPTADDRCERRQHPRQARGEDRDAEQPVARRDDPERQRRLVEKGRVQVARHQEIAGLEHRDRRVGRTSSRCRTAAASRRVRRHTARAGQQDDEAESVQRLRRVGLMYGVVRTEQGLEGPGHRLSTADVNSSWLWGVESNHQPSG